MSSLLPPLLSYVQTFLLQPRVLHNLILDQLYKAADSNVSLPFLQSIAIVHHSLAPPSTRTHLRIFPIRSDAHIQSAPLHSPSAKDDRMEDLKSRCKFVVSWCLCKQILLNCVLLGAGTQRETYCSVRMLTVRSPEFQLALLQAKLLSGCL